jgi:hypothetical protein
LQQSYRFGDKFSIKQNIIYNPSTNDAGFYQKYAVNNILEDVIFSRRDLKTIENIFSAKYNFNNRSGITFRARHYWSKVENKELYDLQNDGSLKPSLHASVVPLIHRNFNIFNIDALYTWQFAPGSFINIVWKDESYLGDENVRYTYFKNFDNTIASPQNNNLSIKIIYYLDYLYLKNWKKKRLE